MNRLEGKNILITGASRGLGRQLALDFAQEGVTGMCITSRRANDLNEVKESILKVSPDLRVAVDPDDAPTIRHPRNALRRRGPVGYQRSAPTGGPVRITSPPWRDGS